MKILLEYDEAQGASVNSYIVANGNDPERYFKSRLPHPLNKFISVICNYKEPKIKRKYKRRTPCV